MVSPEQLAELARKLREQTPGTPEREAFLNRLAEEIRTGQYQVDTTTLARKLVDNWPESSEPD